MRHYYLQEGVQKSVPALKVPRQCPFVFVVEALLREGKAFTSEEARSLRSGLL
jgi:hypothetical protein